MTRDRKLIAVFSTIAAVCASMVGNHIATANGPPAQALHASVPIGADNRLAIQFVGDTMLGDAAQAKLNKRGYDWPLQKVKAALHGDYVIANAEGAFTQIPRPVKGGKKYLYTVDPGGTGALKRAGIDAFSLANNHAMDAGPRGLEDALSLLKRAEMPAVGAGLNLRRAEQPLLLHSKIGTVGVVALGENFGSSSKAEETQAGTLVLSAATVQRGIDIARAAGADWVIAFVHWGDNYLPVNDEQRYWAHMLVNAGYDMVVGAGAHIAQPIEFIRDVPVVYGLGNFVFTTPGRFDRFGVSGYGLVLTVELSKTKAARLSVRCLVVDNEVVSFQPRICPRARAARFLPTLNARAVMDGNRAFLRCTCFARKS